MPLIPVKNSVDLRVKVLAPLRKDELTARATLATLRHLS